MKIRHAVRGAEEAAEVAVHDVNLSGEEVYSIDAKNMDDLKDALVQWRTVVNRTS